MEMIINKVPCIKTLVKKKKVVAYARVSSGKDAMLHSLKSQVDHYKKVINAHNDWLFAGVYADEAISGTKSNREQFNKMIDDCKQGKVDLILTKSISRFARNTLLLLESIRELKELNVNVYFEEQNIYSLSGDGELMLTILGSFAQEEARSVSENQKWRVLRNFESGIPWNTTVYGYDYNHKLKRFEVNAEEAKVVSFIFNEYLSGKGKELIALELNKKGIKTKKGFDWCPSQITWILKNITYTGNLLLQKTFNENYMNKKKVMNKGEKQMYYVEEAHEPIVDVKTFEDAQQALIERETNKGQAIVTTYPFTGLLRCGCCSSLYKRQKTKYEVKWICRKYSSFGLKECSSKAIPEHELIRITKEVLNLDSIDDVNLKDFITFIEVFKDNTLIYHLTSGEQLTRKWKDKSRKDSWTEAMKNEARKKELERRESLWQR